MGQNQKNIVRLNPEERVVLEREIKKGTWKAREIQRARILLFADIDGPYAYQDLEIAEKLGCTEGTVTARRKRFAMTRSIEDTIFDKPRSGRPTIVDGATEAHITMIACSTPPEGYAKWSLRLIRERVIEFEAVEEVSAATVGRVLKKTSLNLG